MKERLILAFLCCFNFIFILGDEILIKKSFPQYYLHEDENLEIPLSDFFIGQQLNYEIADNWQNKGALSIKENYSTKTIDYRKENILGENEMILSSLIIPYGKLDNDIFVYLFTNLHNLIAYSITNLE
jgi:hypothetical protein